MNHITHQLNCFLNQPEQGTANMQRTGIVKVLAFLALVGVLLGSAGSRKALAQTVGQKAIGHGAFINNGNYGSIYEVPSFSGSDCAFHFNVETVNSAGKTKGQLEFHDKTNHIKIHASLNSTGAEFGYPIYGTARVSVGRVSIPGDCQVVLFTFDDPDYFALLLYMPGGQAQAWSGELTKGNITIR